MAPAVSNTNSETGRAIHGGITGFVVSGGSPDPTCDFNTTLPTITSARCVAAFPSVERSGTPKPNEAALASALGGSGAEAAAACCEGEGNPVCDNGGRGCSGWPICGRGVAATMANGEAVTAGPLAAGRL
jgi:hypothetical protein